MVYAMMLLNQLKSYVSSFKKDEDGAALIEYTVLLAIILIAVITTDALLFVKRRFGWR